MRARSLVRRRFAPARATLACSCALKLSKRRRGARVAGGGRTGAPNGAENIRVVAAIQTVERLAGGRAAQVTGRARGGQADLWTARGSSFGGNKRTILPLCDKNRSPREEAGFARGTLPPGANERAAASERVGMTWLGQAGVRPTMDAASSKAGPAESCACPSRLGQRRASLRPRAPS